MANRTSSVISESRARALRRKSLIAGALFLALLLLAACGGNGDEVVDTADDDADTAEPDTDPDDDGDADDGDDADDGESILLRYAFYGPGFPEIQMEQWAAEIEERTNGRVQVQTFPGGSLLDAGDMYPGVVRGVADIGMGSPNLDVGRFPLLSAVTLPLDFPNAVVSSLTMAALIEEFELAELADFEVIAVFTGEPGYLQTIEHVTTLEDLQGKEIRVTGGGIEAVRELGGVPVPMPMPEVPEALQTGVIEGVMTSREVVQLFGLADHINYIVDKPISTGVTFAALMPRGRWDELPSDVQDLIVELREKYTLLGAQLADQQAADGIQFGIDGGIELVDLSAEEEARWNERLEPIVANWIEEMEAQGLPGTEVITRTQELRDQFAAEHG